MDFVLDEDVLTPSVVNHGVSVEDTGLGDFSSLVRISGLLHLKLLNHLINCTLDGVQIGSKFVGIALTSSCPPFIIPMLITVGVVSPESFDGRVIDDDILKNRSRESRVSPFTGVLVPHVLNTLLEGALSGTGRSRFARGVGVVIVIEATLFTTRTGLLTGTSSGLSRLTVIGVIGHAGTRILTGLVTLTTGTRLVTRLVGIVRTRTTLTGLVRIGGVLTVTTFTFTRTRLRRILVLLGFLLRLILLVLFLLQLIEFTGEGDDILKCLSLTHASHILLFISRERHRNLAVKSNLELKIETVDEGKTGKVFTHDFEQVTVMKGLVSGSKVTAKARELCFNHAFDAGVFDHIQEHMTHTRVTHKVLPTLSWSMQGVGYFMSDEHVVHSIVHVLPDWKTEDTILCIEVRGLGSR